MKNIKQLTRDKLPAFLAENNFNLGAEIGTDRGYFAQALCEANPNLSLFCIDPWKIYEGFYSREDSHFLNVNYNNTKKRLAPFNCKIIRQTSMDAVSKFEDGFLDFVYIDANHDFKYVYEDITKWTDKVRSGGIVCGDDYDWYHKKRLKTDVKDAVKQYLKEKDIKTLYLLTEGRSVNWLFIKP